MLVLFDFRQRAEERSQPFPPVAHRKVASATSWDTFTEALPFTTDANSSRDDTAWRLNACLRRPKQQSGANFVCPAIKKFNVPVIDLC